MSEKKRLFTEIRTPSSYPASAKRYFYGSRPGVKVPYREVSLSETHHSVRVEQNPSVPLYDTSGPYTDADGGIESANVPLALSLSAHLSSRTQWSKCEPNALCA